MNSKEIINKLGKSDFTDLGFSLIISDVAKNIGYVKDNGSCLLRVGLPYSRNSFAFQNALTTICFKELEKLFTDLCSESIIGKINTEFTDEQKEEHYLFHTTSIHVKKNTPYGDIESVFKYKELKDVVLLEETDNIDLYIKYLNLYCKECAMPFFNSIPDIQALDNLTDEKDIFEIGLYLTHIPSLKKIIISNLTNNPKKNDYFYNFKNMMEVNYANTSIPAQSKTQILANLSSLEKIKKYFGIK